MATNKNNSQTQTPEILNHQLNEFFPELLKFESVEETEKSGVYQKIKPEVERILNAVVQENFAPESETSATSNKFSVCVTALAWNIERGNRFDGIV
ncbi:MAG TPA: hypothetical protein VGD05_11275, partial [Pyrinomonadaceae bacterium]